MADIATDGMQMSGNSDVWKFCDHRIPALTGNADKVLQVASGETTLEWADRIPTLTSPVRIWSLEAGAYLLPLNCTVYYNGASSNSNFLATGVLYVFEYSSTFKNFFVFSDNTAQEYSTYPEYFIYGGTTSTSGNYFSANLNTNLKQDVLVSGTNIKTINGQSLLGSGDLEIVSGMAKHFYQSSKVNDTRLQGVVYTDNVASDEGIGNGETIACYFSHNVNAGDTITVLDTNGNDLIYNASVYYQNAAITTGIINAGDWAFLIYNSTSNLFMVIATSAPRYTKTVNGSSIVGTGDVPIENWEFYVATDGTTSYTMPSDKGHVHVIVDNRNNSSSLTVASPDGTNQKYISETGGSSVVSAGGYAHFEYKRFTSNGYTFNWVKRSSINYMPTL